MPSFVVIFSTAYAADVSPCFERQPGCCLLGWETEGKGRSGGGGGGSGSNGDGVGVHVVHISFSTVVVPAIFSTACERAGNAGK